MKVTISLDKPKMIVVIEGSDNSMEEMGTLLEEAGSVNFRVVDNHK